MAGVVRLRVLPTCLLYRLLCVCVRLFARGGGERELEIVVLRLWGAEIRFTWRGCTRESVQRDGLGV